MPSRSCHPEPLSRGTVDAALISEQWEKLIRIPRRDMSSCNRYIADKPLRRVIQRQPNREEARQCAR